MAKKRVRSLRQDFFITQEEEQLISEKMQEAGIKNKSAYLRKMALDGYIIRQDYAAVKAAVYELNRIGNNLNQMTKIANTYHDTNRSELEAIQDDLQKIWKLLISHVK